MKLSSPVHLRLVAVFVISLLIPDCVSFGAESEFAAAKQTFLKEIKKKNPDARIAAIKKIAEFPRKETFDLLIKRISADDEEAVIKATRSALRKISDDQAVYQYVRDELKKGLKRPAPNEALLLEFLRALAPTEDAERQVEIAKVLDEYLASPIANVALPITFIDQLADEDGIEAIRSLEVLAKAKSFENQFAYRRSIIQAMMTFRDAQAVTFLIDRLPKAHGIIQFDIIEHLTRLTGQKLRDNDHGWADWWRENQATFKFPPYDEPLPEVTIDDKQLNYFGIPICAKRVVFVLDTSLSMRGAAIESAKQALLKAIDSLPDSVAFGIVMFDGSATTWQPRLVPATRTNKGLASQAVIERGLRGGTVSSAALNAAFELEPEAIYFLSDGEPTDGAPGVLVANFSQFNKFRRVSIHTIGVVTQLNAGLGLTAFMQPLAEQNYGKFRLVE
jgi:HEAT repeat protein